MPGSNKETLCFKSRKISPSVSFVMYSLNISFVSMYIFPCDLVEINNYYMSEAASEKVSSIEERIRVRVPLSPRSLLPSFAPYFPPLSLFPFFAAALYSVPP